MDISLTFSVSLCLSLCLFHKGPRVYDYQSIPGGVWRCHDPDQARFNATNCDGIDFAVPGSVLTLEVAADELNQVVWLQAQINNLLYKDICKLMRKEEWRKEARFLTRCFSLFD
jgi:hypothetical protein